MDSKVMVVEWVLGLLFFSILLAGIVQTSATINRSTHHEFDINFSFAEYVEVDALGPPWPWPGRYIELMEEEEVEDGNKKLAKREGRGGKNMRVAMKL